MSNITVIGIDLAKNVFQLHGVDKTGTVILQKRIKSRDAFVRFMAKLPPCLIGMEACGSAHYWSRRFVEFGHEVKLMHAKYVKAFVERNKHDAADARACYIAVCQPGMKTIPTKDIGQQAELMLHKYRSRLLKQRTQLSNQMRGFLYELGFVIPKGSSSLRRKVAEILGDDYSEEQFPRLARTLLNDMLEEFIALEEKLSCQDQRILNRVKADESCQRLQSLPGIGPVTASAFKASLQGYPFEKGRQAAAWIGLTPKESSSGGTKRLLGISKQGNKYLRSLLIHGARSVVNCADKKEDRLSRWLQRLIRERGFNKAVVALANKTARRAWSILAHQTNYHQDFADYYDQAA